MTRKRNYVYLENASDKGLSWQRIEKYMDQYNINSRGEAFERIFDEYEALKAANEGVNMLSKEIASELKPMLDPIRIRTGYVDKNVRVLLNLLNSYIIVNGMEDSLPVTDVVAESVRNTQKQVADQIHAYQVARKDKLTRSAAGDDNE